MKAIDFGQLLREISPGAPSGECLDNDSAFLDVEKKIEGTPEKWVGHKCVQEARDPNWSQIQESALKLLMRSHDLRVAIFLIRALLHTQGFIGVRDGLTLLKGLIENYWDTLYPQLDPGHNVPTQRITILLALCHKSIFIDPLMGAWLCVSKALGRYSLRDIHIAAGKLTVSKTDEKPPPNLKMIEAAFRDSDLEDLHATKEAIDESLLCVNDLETLLKEKVVSSEVPDFSKLRRVLREMGDYLDAQVANRSPSEPLSPDEASKSQKPAAENRTAAAQSGTSQVVNAMETIKSRQDVILILDQICKYYEQNEPASPVPWLLKRAKRLVEKNFFEIMQDVAPENVAQIKKLISGPTDDKS